MGCVIVAILCNNHKQSSMQRFIKDRIGWLRELFGRPDGKAISRAQLPRILDVVDWEELNKILEELLNKRIEGIDGEWKAVDGKSLRGTIKDANEAYSHERIVNVVGHESQKTYHQRPISGKKASEVTVVRELLEGCA